MKKEQMISAFEAVLFSSGEPMSIERLSQVFEISSERVDEIVSLLEKKLNEGKSGFEVLRLENTYQLATRAEFAPYIKKAFDIRRRTPLSPAALEVLSVIAYNQPVTKSFIEQVRGVDCSGVVSTLLEKGLVEERGRLELPGKPLLYGTTKVFLRSFGLRDLDDLPPIPKAQHEINDVGEQLELAQNEQETADQAE